MNQNHYLNILSIKLKLSLSNLTSMEIIYIITIIRICIICDCVFKIYNERC